MSPCNAVAVRQARMVKVNNAEALLSSPEALAVCKKLLAQLWEMDENMISVDKGRDFVRFNAGLWYVRIWDKGGVEANPVRFLEQIKSMLDTVIPLALQLRVQAAVAAEYQILGQQRAAAGELVLTVEL